VTSDDFRGKTALVTGSTSGIGLGFARALARQGVTNVILHGIELPLAAAPLVTQFSKEFRVKVMYDNADITQPKLIEGLCKKALGEFGAVDILVNNAGIQYIAPCTEFPESKWEAVIATNLSAVFYFTRYLLPGMLKKNWGRVVNTASVHGLVASVDKSAYVAAKHGVIGFTKAVALETAKTGVTCNAICPGWVRTALVQKQVELRAERLKVSVEEGAMELLREKQPSLQFVSVDELAEVLLFLCSPAANQIRGVSLPVDGAWTVQ